MKLPSNYEQSKDILAIGTFDNEASIDVLSKEFDVKNFNPENAENIINRLSVALIAVVTDEIEHNTVLKTAPLLNLCRYIIYKFPELVMDDELYALRRALIRMGESLRENIDADVIVDSFMELDVEDINRRYQLQVVAVSEKHGFVPNDKIHIFRHDEEQ